MSVYRVTYQSMTAFYGPKFIEADDELDAKRKFAGTAFRTSEFSLMHAREVGANEISRASRKAEEE